MTKKKTDEPQKESELVSLSELEERTGISAEELFERQELVHVGRKIALKRWLVSFYYLPSMLLLPFLKDLWACFRGFFGYFYEVLFNLYEALKGYSYEIVLPRKPKKEEEKQEDEEQIMKKNE